jgi:hypothetical protein
MSFQPIPYLDCHICEIEILETLNISSNTTPINLGSILVDTGGQISITNNFINFPANMEFFVKSNLIVQAVNTGVTSAPQPSFLDASNALVSHQAYGLSIMRTGAQWFSSVDCLMMLFSSASTRSIKLGLVNVSSTLAINVPYNSATSYIPNSTITIMYK